MMQIKLNKSKVTAFTPSPKGAHRFSQRSETVRFKDNE